MTFCTAATCAPSTLIPGRSTLRSSSRAIGRRAFRYGGITIQNEPMAVQRWESCVYQAGDERDFLKDYLGPVMVQQGLRDVNIIVWDHNRDLIIQRAQTIFDDSQAAKYVWGIGFHWYEDWSGGHQLYGNVALVNRLYPDKHILFTEGTPASFDSAGYGRWSQIGRAHV